MPNNFFNITIDNIVGNPSNMWITKEAGLIAGDCVGLNSADPLLFLHAIVPSPTATVYPLLVDTVTAPVGTLAYIYMSSGTPGGDCDTCYVTQLELCYEPFIKDLTWFDCETDLDAMDPGTIIYEPLLYGNLLDAGEPGETPTVNNSVFGATPGFPGLPTGFTLAAGTTGPEWHLNIDVDNINEALKDGEEHIYFQTLCWDGERCHECCVDIEISITISDDALADFTIDVGCE